MVIYRCMRRRGGKGGLTRGRSFCAFMLSTFLLSNKSCKWTRSPRREGERERREEAFCPACCVKGTVKRRVASWRRKAVFPVGLLHHMNDSIPRFSLGKIIVLLRPPSSHLQLPPHFGEHNFHPFIKSFQPLQNISANYAWQP